MSQPQQRYQVLEKVAAGGMAEVYRAESAGLEGFKKTVAIKRVLPHLAEKRSFIGMFLDEARLSAHLSHSNCVQVFDVGHGDGTYFIVMEYVDGADLKALAERWREMGRPFPMEEACHICVKVCEGLAYAHSLTDPQGTPLGIVHRDMSPPNVLITRYGEVKIVDFGLAKANSQLEESEPGIIKGKFGYLSPEAALGHGVDSRTDVFAVGIILWELLAGRRLFQGETDLETVQRVQTCDIPSLSAVNPNVPLELDQIIMRTLARDPADRYQTAWELGRDLNQFLFQFGRGVSSFDIASLIADLIRVRDTERNARRKRSIIGNLIDDTLFEFTSLQDTEDEQAAATSPVPGAAPLNLGTFEGFRPNRRSSHIPAGLEPGNLAALEDGPLAPAPNLAALEGPDADSLVPPAVAGRGGYSNQTDGAAMRMVSNQGGEMQVSASEAAAVPADGASARRAMWVAVVILIALGALGAGAYFAGVLP
jgi:eukaryotic-like serine/threonine-protein kinase